MNRASQSQLVQIFGFLAMVMMVHVINLICGMWLNQLGVVPRTFVGSRGILFSPLLHGNWTHLVANLAPLGVMLCLLAFVKGRALWPITAMIWLATGFAIWIVGRPDSVQIGASGLIYGLAAFLVATAWFKRDLKSAVAALIVIVLYGSIVWGLLPGRAGVSWEGHLSGAVAGILVAVVTVSAKESLSS